MILAEEIKVQSISLLHRPLQLPAGCVDVAAARPAQVHRNSLTPQRTPERLDSISRWRGVRNPRPWIPCDQIHLRRQSSASHQSSYLRRVSRLICHSPQQHVFKCDPLA
jgi:hypothetical protein